MENIGLFYLEVARQTYKILELLENSRVVVCGKYQPRALENISL
jgi:hypothetical protein